MIVVFFVVLIIFTWIQMTARVETPSLDSGANFVITAVMAVVLVMLASFSLLTVSVGDEYIALKFGFGIFRKKFKIKEVTSVERVKNYWYYGFGIRPWFWPRMWIFNVSGLDAVEIRMKNGKIYRLGTDEPEKLETAIKSIIT